MPPVNPINKTLRIIARLIPKPVFVALQPVYHYLLALSSATLFGFPSRRLKIVAVTGTKGKSTTTEFVNGILEAAGHKTAVLGTIRFKVGDLSWANKFKMTVPGRFFVQKFLHDAVEAGCEWVVLEMSSEAVKQSRHLFINFDALIFTNLAPEHIESHGSYEKYRDAKLSLARTVVNSPKQSVVIVANADDAEGHLFLEIAERGRRGRSRRGLPYRLTDGAPHEVTLEGSTFTFRGTSIHLHIPGVFNIMNALGAATFAEAQSIPLETIALGLSNISLVRGRVEYITLPDTNPDHDKQRFSAIVDYAHTPESLESLYTLFQGTHTICVLGNTGGGRDTWKRPVMAGIAEKYCNEIILTNEDPYDEKPEDILTSMEEGIADKQKVVTLLDRRTAIHEALDRATRRASSGQALPVAVLLTGKGTDPYIMGANDAKVPWDDATVVREELEKIMKAL